MKYSLVSLCIIIKFNQIYSEINEQTTNIVGSIPIQDKCYSNWDCNERHGEYSTCYQSTCICNMGYQRQWYENERNCTKIICYADRMCERLFYNTRCDYTKQECECDYLYKLNIYSQQCEYTGHEYPTIPNNGTNNDDDDDYDDKTTSIGTIVGGVFGAFIGLAIVAFCCYCCCCRSRRNPGMVIGTAPIIVNQPNNVGIRDNGPPPPPYSVQLGMPKGSNNMIHPYYFEQPNQQRQVTVNQSYLQQPAYNPDFVQTS